MLRKANWLLILSCLCKCAQNYPNSFFKTKLISHLVHQKYKYQAGSIWVVPLNSKQQTVGTTVTVLETSNKYFNFLVNALLLLFLFIHIYIHNICYKDIINLFIHLSHCSSAQFCCYRVYFLSNCIYFQNTMYMLLFSRQIQNPSNLNLNVTNKEEKEGFFFILYPIFSLFPSLLSSFNPLFSVTERNNPIS